MTITNEIIDTLFEDKEEFEDYMYNFINKKINACNIDKDRGSFCLTIFALSGGFSEKSCYTTTCLYWHRRVEECRFKIDIREELYNYNVNIYKNKNDEALSLINVYYIVKDLFNYVWNDIKNSLKTNKLNFYSEYIYEEKQRFYKVPQYTILYYDNKTEIYRCET